MSADKRPRDVELLTADEMAAALRVRTETMRRHLQMGSIRGSRVGAGPHGAWRIPLSELRRITEGEPR